MSISEIFTRNSVGTMLLTIALALAGILAFRMLPVAPLPEVEFPTVQVQAMLPGASPETMASAVATPLERQFGRIASLTELTSTSSLGATTIVLQFDLSRDINAAARDVQAAINAARSQLPSNLPNNPTYRKVNPADAPILILALTSETLTRGQIYDAASSVLVQKLSQLQGIGQVIIGGGAAPAVRVDLSPNQLNNYGVGLEQVRTMLASSNVNRPKGALADEEHSWTVAANDQLLKAADYRPLIVAYHNGAAVHLSDIARVTDSAEDLRTDGVVDGKPAVMLIIFRQPGANIIETVDRVTEALPQLEASIPPAIKTAVVLDRSTSIRASVRDVEITLLISIMLVVLVVFVFLRDARATVIPGVVVPLSLIGTFGVMYLLGYSLDSLSLMALTISTGFVVDDAIVVIENIFRLREQGVGIFQAAIEGAAGINFTVVSMSLSLVAVFIPILLMSGIVGRLFREFAVTLSSAILVSLVISLTTTPMLCSKLLTHEAERKPGLFYRMSERGFNWMLTTYERTLGWALRHSALMLMAALAMVALNVALFIVIPKGFFPEQDTGRLMGALQADQDTSFQAMRHLLHQFVATVKSDPAVANVIAFTGGAGGATNTARMFIALKPPRERQITAAELIGRLRKKSSHIAGAALYLQAVQDLRIGGRLANAEYQYTLQGEDLQELNQWAPRLVQQMHRLPEIADVISDQQNNGLEASLVIDRDTAARLGLSAQLIDNTLYDAFGQRQVSTMYTQLNQYHVVMEVAPEFWQNPDVLRDTYVQAPSGREVPLSAFTHYRAGNTPLAVNHQGQFPSVTVSFNVKPGMALGDAVNEIENTERTMRMPGSIHGNFAGTAQAFQSSLANEPILIVAALFAVYVVLGILYESYIHPITILSTLPSAGVGALLALLLFHEDLTVIALIGIVLLIGIVKKNAIMMIDFALETERGQNATPRDAIYQACLLRFRPIMMTTMAALLGGLPLALGTGVGSELRRPLGIAIVGGLIVSQMLTLYTTPVIYLYLDRLRLYLLGTRPQAHTATPEQA